MVKKRAEETRRITATRGELSRARESPADQGFLFVLFLGSGAYPRAECGDLENALDGEHPGEAYVTVLQCFPVRLALLVVLQCTH